MFGLESCELLLSQLVEPAERVPGDRHIRWHAAVGINRDFDSVLKSEPGMEKLNYMIHKRHRTLTLRREIDWKEYVLKVFHERHLANKHTNSHAKPLRFSTYPNDTARSVVI